ncbi:MAG: SDR family oxidoreductase [Planctomycetaceae bacterium]|nr:SDR family oxidoreductase [Planctomycetaceae bacterium]
MREFEHQWGLITGGSAGIGAAYAAGFAERGMNLILVARRQERLEELAGRLCADHGIDIVPLALDLLNPTGFQQLVEFLEQREQPLDLLINNAGLGHFSTCDQTDIARVEQVVQLNVAVLTRLTYQVLPGMLARRSGTIINLASRASFQPVAYMSVYAASKAYVLSFTEGLGIEVRKHGVQLLAVCPPLVKTEFLSVANMPSLAERLAMSPEKVVVGTLRALRRRKLSVTIGFVPKLLTLLPRFLPRYLMAAISLGYLRPEHQAE